MPYKTDKDKLNCPFFDKRVKLLPCQKERLILLYKNGTSQRKLAKIFNVSRRLIQFIIFPEKKVRDLELRELRGGSKHYYKGGEEWAKTQRIHRKYKYKILKDIEK
jgi:hypothetical protein